MTVGSNGISRAATISFIWLAVNCSGGPVDRHGGSAASRGGSFACPFGIVILTPPGYIWLRGLNSTRGEKNVSQIAFQQTYQNFGIIRGVYGIAHESRRESLFEPM